MHPSFNINLIDVVTDRNNIRKLLSFVNPVLATNMLDSFAISIEVIKETAIFCRKEDATHRYIGSHEFKGFGHEFERAYTTSEITGSTGHHRIISYHFGGLSFLVRHETDGYVDHNSKTQLTTDRLSNAMSSLSLFSSSGPQKSVPAQPTLAIKEQGREIPVESTLEIKTRTSNRELQSAT
ncbi:hypothetical protein BGZ63DRAFT_397764 [Mariannaea sp. PMI_226]|nr:hypothetical protein BGZ63DRAFT_397764 [Mariannaea sp. PMI_226]